MLIQKDVSVLNRGSFTRINFCTETILMHQTTKKLNIVANAAPIVPISFINTTFNTRLTTAPTMVDINNVLVFLKALNADARIPDKEENSLDKSKNGTKIHA